MLFNYFTTAIRAARHQKQHFMLNIIGFSIGIAAAILIALFANNELSIDDNQPDAERVYRVYVDYTAMGLSKDGAISADIPLSMQNHSQIESLMILVQSYFLHNNNYPLPDLVSKGGNNFKLRRFYAASANIQEFVNIQVIEGELDKVLQRPDQLALSASEAARLFGRVDIIGETLSHEAGIYTVGAVFADLPIDTHFAFDALAFLPNVDKGPYGAHVYVKLHEGSDIHALAGEMTAERHRRSPNLKQTSFDLIQLPDVHFNSNGEFEMKQGGSELALKVSLILSGLLVLIASVNFINFNIAGATRRAKEIGVRKALGASKAQLVAQFMLESLLIVVLAGVIAMALVEWLLPGFNQLMDRQLSIEYQSTFMLMVMAVIVLVGLVSGLYPALFMSAFSAKRVLSGDLSRGRAAIWVRKLTLCMQGAFSIGLIIAMLTLGAQMSFIQQLDVGYAKEGRLIIRELPADLIYQKNDGALFAALKAIDGIEQISLSDTNYATAMLMGHNFTWPNGETLTGMQPNIVTGYHAVEALGLKLLAGRDFSPQFSGDWYVQDAEGNRRAGVLVTETLAKSAGYNDLQSVVGMTLTIPRRNLTATVVGVVADIRLGSVTKPVLPSSFILGYIRNDTGNIVLKTATTDKQALLAKVQAVVAEHLLRTDIVVDWIEQEFHAAHKNEAKTLTMVGLFSPLAIFLTCLGTFGLASFATIRRQKEVAIRKVIGASRISIVNLLAKEFLLLVVISLAFAFPVSYWLLNDWLANFNDRVDQSLWVYLAAAACVAVITWLTVAILAFKAANSRPSRILRYE